jgi:hypothetical protein
LLVQGADVFGIEWNAAGCKLFWLNPRDLHRPYPFSADRSSVQETEAQGKDVGLK